MIPCVYVCICVCVCPMDNPLFLCSLKEPNNLASKHAYKFSSVQRKAVGVNSGADNKGVELVTKRTKCKTDLNTEL